MIIHSFPIRLYLLLTHSSPSFYLPTHSTNSAAVPADVIEREKAVARQTALDAGKKPEVVEKMVEGRLRKYFEEVCLVQQNHMLEEGNPQVRDRERLTHPPTHPPPTIRERKRKYSTTHPPSSLSVSVLVLLPSLNPPNPPTHPPLQVAELFTKTAAELGVSLELASFLKYRTGEE